MITLDRVTKYYPTQNGRHYVLDDVSLVVPLGRNIGVIGKNGAGKSTLLRLMAGVEYPDQGRIYRVGRYSWPLALAGRGVQNTMTGRENVVFAARIHGLANREIERLVDRVQEFAELGDFFALPVSTYSSGMRARLSFAIAMLFEFDCYFIDELNAVGDSRFRKLTAEYFKDKRKTATFIQVSHDLDDLHQTCEAGILVDGGQAVFFDNVDDAIVAYREAMGEEPPEVEKPPQVVAAPVIVAKSRQARRLAAQAMKRQHARKAKQASRPAAEPAASAATPVQRSWKARRKNLARAKLAPQVDSDRASTDRAEHQKTVKRSRVNVQHDLMQISLSPARQLALKRNLIRRPKARVRPGGNRGK